MGQLQIQGLQKRYDEVVAISDFSLTIERGEWVTLLGPSGSGKSTILRMVAGFIQPSAGQIQLEDQTLTSVEQGIFLPPEQRGLGMVFQSYAVWPHMTVYQNVAYPLKFRSLDKVTQQTKVGQILELVQMGHLSSRYPGQLSGGQQQRVALARALVMEPRLLLLDEPLSNLDAKLREDLRVEITELHRRLHTTVIYVTHDQAEALSMSDRVVVLDHGHMQQVDTPQGIYQTPANTFVAQFVGSANLLPATVTQVTSDRLQVKVEIGSQSAVCPVAGTQVSKETLGIDQRVTILIRPEQWQLQDPEQGTWRGRVQRRIYQGDRIGYRVEVEGISLQISSSQERFQEGDPVGISASHCVLLPDEVKDTIASAAIPQMV